ncbi:hypothetical protein NDU88_004623 [Pleurodeles waltl]|uniref:Uncharacterized protein n=1 Tax=Pleurodeles waltl TaxID=8319 RepID=A0AAV7W8P0_PLEWA|nr:hypothetical protein NDU88_004623 [Pleurodeles waltl]
MVGPSDCKIGRGPVRSLSGGPVERHACSARETQPGLGKRNARSCARGEGGAGRRAPKPGPGGRRGLRLDPPASSEGRSGGRACLGAGREEKALGAPDARAASRAAWGEHRRGPPVRKEEVRGLWAPGLPCWDTLRSDRSSRAVRPG